MANRSAFRIGSIVVLALFLAAFLNAGHVQASENVSIRGATLLRDGQPWIPKGVVVTGLVSAAGTAGPVGPVYVIARENWSPAEITAIRGLGADTINLKVSQPALDPQGGFYDQNYLAKIKAAVALARNAGLDMILSMEWEPPTGVFGQSPMPTDAHVLAPYTSTARAWQTLAPAFGSDSGVMYQLFDEPCAKQNTPQAWQSWQHGHQAAIDVIRAVGAKNVLIAEGIRCGKWLTNVPPLRDPLNSLAYGVHPYPMPEGVRRSTADNFTAEDFDRNFGDWQAQGHVVIATEWDIWDGNCHDGTDGNPTSPQIATALLGYLTAHHIGLAVWAADLPGTIWLDRHRQYLTHLAPFRGCVGHHVGVGATVTLYWTSGQVVAR